MASSAAPAPSTGFRSLQIAVRRVASAIGRRVESWLDAERDQLPLWIPVFLGTGIAAWFLLPDPARWAAVIAGAAGVALLCLAVGRGGRALRWLALAGVLVALGCALIWWRAERVAAPVIERPGVFSFTARIERVEPLSARGIVRLTVAPGAESGLPPRVRVNLMEKDAPRGLSHGAVVRMRAFLMPPPEAAIPGAYDFARVAWFAGIGGTGRAFAPVTVVTPGDRPESDVRMHLSRHVRERVGGAAGAIAATLATGDRGAIAESDAEAMRRSGLAHLLSISGLHVTAVTGAVMLFTLRFLALFPWLALRVRLPLVAAGAAAMAAVGYTLLTGAEVPTVRSCAAALLVLAAMALGREAITLRLIAAGALFVLLLWPESLIGASFQLSFAAVTALVALHEHPRMRQWGARDAAPWWNRMGRGVLSLFLTGVVVEAVLTPIALFHFHQSGVYGALANILAIPLTTFVVMPLEALALLFDIVGLGAPFWWGVGQALRLLLSLAHTAADAPGATTQLPAMPRGAFALFAYGALWAGLWRTEIRWWGLGVAMLGLAWAVATPAPDLVVTRDGRHMAVRMPDGQVVLLRDRAGNYVRALLAENTGTRDALAPLSSRPEARCNSDACVVDVRVAGAGMDAGTRVWRIAATRSSYYLPLDSLVALCRASDIMVSERRMPRDCVPRHLLFDAATLERTGGVAVSLRTGAVRATHPPGDRHPWLRVPDMPMAQRPTRTEPAR